MKRVQLPHKAMKKVFSLIFAVCLLFSLCSCGEINNSCVVSVTDRLTGEQLNLALLGVKSGQSFDAFSTKLETSLSLDELSAQFEGKTTDDNDEIYLVKKTDTKAVYKVNTYEGRIVYFCLSKTGDKSYILHDCTANLNGIRVAFPYYAVDDCDFTAADEVNNTEFAIELDYFSIIEYYKSLSVYSIIEGIECFELASTNSEDAEIKNALPVTISFKLIDDILYMVFTQGEATMETVYVEEEGMTDGGY